MVHDDAEAALARGARLLRGGVPASVLDHIIGRAPNVEWIHSFSAGVERVATPAVRSRGLTVTNARGVFSRPIAEYVVMMCLAIARRLPQLLELQRDRTWQPLRGTELGSLTVGIVGYGSIGSEIARLLAPFETQDPGHPPPSGPRAAELERRAAWATTSSTSCCGAATSWWWPRRSPRRRPA